MNSAVVKEPCISKAEPNLAGTPGYEQYRPDGYYIPAMAKGMTPQEYWRQAARFTNELDLKETKYSSGFNPVLIKDIVIPGVIRTWVWENMLPEGGLICIASNPKVGKSEFCYQLAFNVEQGTPFLGLATTKSPVLFIDLEDDIFDIHKRAETLNTLTYRVYVADNAPAATREVQIKTLIDIKTFCVEKGVKLIILNSLTQYWDVTDENSSAQTAPYIKPLLALARFLRAGVVLIHHTTKSGDVFRGSGAIFSTVDSGFVLKKTGIQNQRRLINAGGRWGRETPKELLVTLNAEGLYVLETDPQVIKAQIERDLIIACLSDEGVNVETIGGKIGLKPQAVRDHFKEMPPDAYIAEGNGTKGDPVLYRLPVTP